MGFGWTNQIVYKPEHVEVGLRKLSLSVYVMHRVWAAVVAEVALYLAMRQFTDIEHKHIIEMFTMINWLFVTGSAAALGIYAGTNAWSKKYTSPYQNGGGYNGGYMGHGEYQYRYGASGQGQGGGALKDPVHRDDGLLPEE